MYCVVHGCGIVHGDLTGVNISLMSSCRLLLISFSQSNVLIKDNGKACLSDFGLSRIFMETTGSSYLTSTVRGSVRWAAPELFEIDEEQQEEPVHVLPNPQSDIYSFGSTMLQVRIVRGVRITRVQCCCRYSQARYHTITTRTMHKFWLRCLVA